MASACKPTHTSPSCSGPTGTRPDVIYPTRSSSYNSLPEENAPPSSRARPGVGLSPESLAEPDSKFIELRGVKVHYKLEGAGTHALILMHGFGGSVFSWYACGCIRARCSPTLNQEASVAGFDGGSPEGAGLRGVGL